MEKDRYPLFCLIIYILAFILCAINPWYFQDWALESILPLLLVVLLVFFYKKLKLSNTSYTLILIFLIFHTIGSHYTYSNMPLTENLFGLTRNYYDRIVHFLFGLLMYLPISEFSKRFFKKKSKIRHSITIVIIIVLSGFVFELMEGAVYLFMHNAELMRAYLATQGGGVIDDSLKDIFVKFIGGLISAVFFYNKKIK